MSLPTKDEIGQFLALINPLPGYKILEVFYETSDLQEALKSLDTHYSDIIFGNERPLDKPFRALPREYDTIVLNKILLKHKYPERILKIVYTALANAAHVIIIEEQGCADVKVFELLEGCDFRAANQINIFNDKKVFVAKKMHSWGNGL